MNQDEKNLGRIEINDKKMKKITKFSNFIVLTSLKNVILLTSKIIKKNNEERFLSLFIPVILNSQDLEIRSDAHRANFLKLCERGL